MNSLDKLAKKTENNFVNLAEGAGHEIMANKLVDVAFGALLLGTALATRGRFATVIADFPKASDLLDGFTGASAKASRTVHDCSSDGECARAFEERINQESITKLAMLMTRNSEAARAARLASEDSGELTKGETNSAGKGIGLILFDNAKEGAKAFLDKAQGNHFTAYLNSLDDSEVLKILGD
jgi:hypothetical protein